MGQENRWIALDRVVAETGFRLPPAIVSELAARLREAIEAKDPATGRGLAAQLNEIVHGLFHEASPEARAAAGDESGRPATPAGQAYALGQAGFAYQLAANLVDRRADANFEDVLRSETFGPYVRALLGEDLSGKQLAAAIGQCEETVSRNLKVLKQIGAVDYRRQKTSFINFLTPAARQVVAQDAGSAVRSRLAEPVRDWARAEAKAILPILRDAQTFAHGDLHRQEPALADD